MRLLGVRPPAHLGHFPLALARRGLRGLLQRIVEGDAVWHRLAVKDQLAEVVYRHTGTDDNDAFFAEGRHGLPQPVVGVWVLGVVERDLH